MNLLQLHHVSYQRTQRTLLQPLSLTLAAGQLIALLGPNGAGKSTLLRICAGLWTPTQGTVELAGRSLQQFSHRALAQRLSFVPQNTQLDFAFTVREVVNMGRYPHQTRWRRHAVEDQTQVQQALQCTDCVQLQDRLMTELSGGERQRVLIARSLATGAELLLLDEPTASLDIAHALEIFSLCRALANGGKTVLIATHDINLAARYADELVLLAQGYLLHAGKTHHVLTASTLAQVFQVHAEPVATPTGALQFFFQSSAKQT